MDLVKRVRKGKKGQEAVSNFGVVTIVLVVFLVVLVLGIFFFNEKISAFFRQVPGNTEAISQGCSVVASERTLESYCYQFREYKKGKEYITCPYAYNDLSISVVDSSGSSKVVEELNKRCNSTVLEKRIKISCTEEEFGRMDKIKINGKMCSDFASDDRASSASQDPSVQQQTSPLQQEEGGQQV